MTIYFDPPSVWPHVTHNDDEDFERVPWWTAESTGAVLGAVDTDTWRLLVDLLVNPGRVHAPQLRTKSAMITALVEALWLRSAIGPATATARRLPDRFTALTTTDPADWGGLGSLAAAWCLARLILFARYTGVGLDRQIASVGPVCWQRLTHDDGSYAYTTELAQKYDSDRSDASQEFIDAITDLANDHLHGRDVIEFGASTGVVSRLVAPHTASLTAIEPAVGLRALLRQRTHGLGNVRVRAVDCMHVDMPDHCADVVYEHAGVGVVDEPIIAVIEAGRLLRPGGSLVRIISCIEPPEQLAAFSAAFHAHLRRLGHGRGRIVSDGNDARITGWLADNGIDTRVDTLASWTSRQPLHRHAAPLLNGSLPYLSRVPASDRRLAIDAALSATGLDVATPICSTRSISTATSTLGGADLGLPLRRSYR